jgi:hypothetical protein
MSPQQNGSSIKHPYIQQPFYEAKYHPSNKIYCCQYPELEPHKTRAYICLLFLVILINVMKIIFFELAKTSSTILAMVEINEKEIGSFS